ncbi:DNA-binding domain-containing protein [Paraglaciecola sp. L3A3]|uniref:HvfC/BufC N-terminal domain-containing protein n=1 Tax=Paraglaciecola sp. L3A3 TaxID=2686358 RepID=UPI00131E748B|nr:DNA-binding domain-containing protein [Paraglaciecola sp. L3A3]
MPDFYAWFEHYLKHGEHQQTQSFLPHEGDQERLLIYRNTYFSACIDILKRKYPSCVNLLGEDYFKMLARQYSQKYIPKTSVLAEYGELMADFIGEHFRQQAPELEYAADLASLDLAWHECYFATDQVPPTDEVVSSWLEDIESKRFALGASVRLLQNKSAVTEVWSMLKNGVLTEPQVIEQQAEYTILWRNSGQIFHRVLSLPEWTFISNIHLANTLIESAEAALTTGELDISSVFSQLIANNLLMEITL